LTDPTPEPAAAGRWKLGERAALTLLLLVLALEGWAWMSTDPDFYLPDPFRVSVLFLVAVTLLTGFLARRRPRRLIRLFFFLTAGAVLVLEARTRFRDPGSGSDRIVQSDDPLLRYHYRPGAELRVGPNRDIPLVVNHLGLMDREHAIPKPKDVFRIVVLTGSIANDGVIPYDDRFYRRLEDQLGTVPDGRKVEVVNVSCEGYSTVQQVRLLEKVGLQYEPDMVIVAYMLSSAAIQNGAYRRIGNSFFLFRFLPMLAIARTGSLCAMFAPFHDSYTFDLVVKNSFERLELLRRIHGFKTMVAVLPVVEEFDDPVCSRLYDKVVATARGAGIEAVRVADAFKGEPAIRFAKPGERYDVAHPNVEGHHRIGDTIAAAVRRMLAEPAKAR
jgi:hypothetical protein